MAQTITETSPANGAASERAGGPAAGPTTAAADEILMALAAAGDQAAFGLLAQRHLPRLVTLAARMLGDRAAAEDAAQEALLRAWRHAGRYDPARAKVTTWLHRITVNLVVDRCRATSRPAAPLPDDIADQRPLAPALIERRQRHQALAEGIAALPDRQRAALLLTYGEQRAGAEAAATLGISTRALEGLLRRGRHFLHDFLRAREI